MKETVIQKQIVQSNHTLQVFYMLDILHWWEHLKMKAIT